MDQVAGDMHKKICSHIKEIKGNISTIITLSNKTTLTVFLKCVSSEGGDPHFIFLDLVEAETTVRCILDWLKSLGFDHLHLSQHLVAFASNGASVMLGQKSVWHRDSNLYLSIMIFQCLELTSGNCISEAADVKHFQSFMDRVHAIYSRSPQNQRELAEFT